MRVRLGDLEPGTLFSYDGCFALKSEYRNEGGQCECYILGTGEMFWGDSKKKINDHLVFPLDFNFLLMQREKLTKISSAWVGIEENGTSEDADNFYTIVQDILSGEDA